MRHFVFLLLSSICLVGCSQEFPERNLKTITMQSPSITGKTEYLASPYVTAGNRVYMVGHQDGSFPDLGWHIKGEMGGIWNHPIKLFDGFDAVVSIADTSVVLNKAAQFTNFPYANMHEFDLSTLGLNVSRWQFVPDDAQGILIQFIVTNTTQEQLALDFLFSATSDLSPTWLGERTDMINTKDKAVYNEKNKVYVFKDSLNPWYGVLGSDLPMAKPSNAVFNTERKDAQGGFNSSLVIAPYDTITFSYVLSGSYKSKEDAIVTFHNIKTNWQSQVQEKRDRYQKLASQSKLITPDSTLNTAFEWLKYNCDWLIREVPEIGSGITAGIPDYPWWFGVDSEYALKGYMTIGQTEAAYNTIKLLDSVSEAVNGNGRIIHEMSTNGAVFNPGNINETPQFASLIWEVYKWNGDKAFLEKYFPTIEKGLDWLLEEQDHNKNMFPDGFGMMEIHGMDSEMIDVAVYTQRALNDAASMASELGRTGLATGYREFAAYLGDLINEEFWSEEFGSYADFIGTDAQALQLIEDAIVRADTLNKPWAVAELNQTKQAILANPSAKPRPFVLHHNWVVNTPMEMLLAPQDKAIRALNTAQKFVNPFGVFVTGIDRDDSAGKDDGSFKGSKIFSYTGAVMTLPTAVQIVGENNYGRPDQALNYLNRMTRSFSYALPGSMYEVSPDYGMITQAWNIYGYGVPLVQQFFGIRPFAAKKQVTISPQMPNSWDNASLENVIIGDGENSISVFYQNSDTKTTIKVTQSNPQWEIIVKVKTQEGYMYNTSDKVAIEKDGPFTAHTTKSDELILEIIKE